jgi:hypothetical protein
MLYVRLNEHEDMYFVCQDTLEEWKIVKVFYNSDTASEYVRLHQKIKDR